MRITRRQYERAVAVLPKLREAEAIVKTWDDAIKAIGPAAEQMEVTEVDANGSFKAKPREVPRVAGEPGRKTA